MNESICNLAVCLVDIPPDRLPGNPKGCCSHLLFKALQVNQVQDRQFFG